MPATPPPLQTPVDFKPAIDTFDFIGNRQLFSLSKIAVFCSSSCSGQGILAAMRQFEAKTSPGTAYVGGFQTEVEKLCLNLMLRAKQPVIIMPARSLTKMRIPQPWQAAIEAGHLLLASPFPAWLQRADRQHAEIRNQMAAAMADEIVVVHCTPSSHLAAQLHAWESAGMNIRFLAN